MYSSTVHAQHPVFEIVHYKGVNVFLHALRERTAAAVSSTRRILCSPAELAVPGLAKKISFLYVIRRHHAGDVLLFSCRLRRPFFALLCNRTISRPLSIGLRAKERGVWYVWSLVNQVFVWNKTEREHKPYTDWSTCCVQCLVHPPPNWCTLRIRTSLLTQ